MKLTTRVLNAYNAFADNEINKDKNGIANPADFLRYGPKNTPMLQDWSQVEMSDQDMYTGYSYAAINKRANRAALLGKRFLYTEAAPKIMDAAKAKEEEVKHPYLDLIKKSKDFTAKKFWRDISTYLDLEGVYYLMAVRAIAQQDDGTVRVGTVQKFVMLNPYEVRRVIRESDGTIGGYIESKNGMYREIPKEMIIEIRLLNPFDNDVPFSMTDAAKENQFTMKQASDYTRHSIRGNINAPGAITTDVVLEPEVFNNFVARIKNHDKGEPLYGNGAGAINWNAMQIDLDKAALDKINEIHRQVLFAVSGTSKTTLGIEESGTTRDTSQVQKDNFTEDAVMPQVEEIIDALNLDYRQWYPEWEQNEYEILLDNPLESDRDSELKDIDIRTQEYELTNQLQGLGYEFDIAAKYAHGEISLQELGEPTLEEELTQQEADEIASREMGVDSAPAEPQDGNEVDSISGSDRVSAASTPTANDLSSAEELKLTINRMVKPEHNQKLLKEARKRVAAREKQRKLDAKAAKAAEKEEAKKAKEEKKTPDTKPVQAPQDKAEEPAVPLTRITTTKVVEPVLASVDEEAKTLNQIAARDYPSLYDGMNIDMDALGCIMLDVEKIPVAQYIKNPDDDLYNETNYDQDALVGEVKPHVTLLFGLLANGNIWKDKVDMLLMGWTLPSITIQEVSFFDLGDSYAIVGLVETTPELLDGHERLTLLPHINTFSEYHPHITLAYIKHDVDPAKWVTPLAKKYNGQKVATKGINYGDLPDEESNNAVEAKEAVANEARTADLSHDDHEHALVPNFTMETATNALDSSVKDDVILQESQLQGAVAKLDGDVVNKVLEALRNGDIDKAQDIVDEAQDKSVVNELVVTLAAFYTVLFPIYAQQLLASRLSEYAMQGVFNMNAAVEADIKAAAKKAALSHIDTIIKDVQRAYEETAEAVAANELVNLVEKKVQEQDKSYTDKLPENPNREDIERVVKQGKFDDDPAYALARQYAREGAGLDQIETAIRQEYAHISATRAKTIARHEASRVFTMSQFEADKQFLQESGFKDQAYKRLRSRSGDPCPICASLIASTRANPIPFAKNFADLGTELHADYKKKNGQMGVMKLPINYEPIKSGNVHVNCNCEYELLIKRDDGTWYNDLRFDNKLGYNPYRDSKGRFSDGPHLKPILKTVTAEENEKILKDAKKSLKTKDDKYPGRLPGEGFTDYANRWLKENHQEAVDKYKARVVKEFDTDQPNIVSADDAKYVIPGFDAERSADYHEPASAFVKQYYSELLANDTSKHLPVMFTAGGTGAGKSTALRGTGNDFNGYATVYDGNLANFDSAVKKINQATASGRNVKVTFVDRNPVIAFKYGVIPRIKSEGRAITVKDHMQTHLDSRNVLARLVEHYKGNENISFEVVDNNGGLNDAHVVPVANVLNNVYNSNVLGKELEREAEEAYNNGQITEPVYRLVANKTADTTSE